MQDLVQVNFEHLQGCGSYSLTGHLSHDQPPGEKFLPYVQLEFCVLKFMSDDCLVPIDLWGEYFHCYHF